MRDQRTVPHARTDLGSSAPSTPVVDALRDANRAAMDAGLTHEDLLEIAAAAAGRLPRSAYAGEVELEGVACRTSSLVEQALRGGTDTDVRGYLILRLPRMTEAAWSPTRPATADPSQLVVRVPAPGVADSRSVARAYIARALADHEADHGPLRAQVEYDQTELPGITIDDLDAMCTSAFRSNMDAWRAVDLEDDLFQEAQLVGPKLSGTGDRISKS